MNNKETEMQMRLNAYAEEIAAMSNIPVELVKTNVDTFTDEETGETILVVINSHVLINLEKI